jgi:hypothetical protein
MSYGLLGPLQVVGDDSEVVVRSGERERVLLAGLPLRASACRPREIDPYALDR